VGFCQAVCSFNLKSEGGAVKRFVFGAVAIILGLALGGLSEEVVPDEVPCFVFQQQYPPGPRLWIFGEPAIEVDGSQPSYVAQGWGLPADCFAGMDAASICSEVKNVWQFELRINGQVIAPDYIIVYRYDPDDPMNPPSDSSLGEEPKYVVRYIYAFPAGRFALGVYFFEGTWTLNEIPCSVCPCQNDEERSTSHGTRTSLVTVTYPVE
jgi:hypothetical protein